MSNAIHTTSRPAEAVPFWSENANYPAGVDPWAATPTAVAPSVGTRNAGHVPATQDPAQYENSVKKSLARYVDFLVDIGAMNWGAPLNHEASLSALSLTLTYVGGSTPSGIQNLWSEYHQAWFVFGENTTGVFYVGDANSLDKFTAGGAKYNFGVVNEATGISVQYNSEVGASIGTHRTAADLSSIGSAVTLPGLSGSSNFACSAKFVPFDETPTGGRIVIVGSNGTGTFVWLSDDSGATYTKVTVDAAFWATNYRMAFRGGEIVIVETGVTSPKAWYSTDVGLTWNARSLPGGTSDNMIDIFYSIEEDAYIVATPLGFLVCPGSITTGFTYRSLSAITTLPVITGWTMKDFAVAGSAILVALGKSTHERRYYLSWDLGVHLRPIGRPTKNAAGLTLDASPMGQFFTTSAVDVQQTMMCAGVGATGRGE